MLGSEDIKKHQLENPEVFTRPEPTVTDNKADLNIGYLQLKLASDLGLASMEQGKYSHEINELIDFARANGAKTMDDILYEIRYLSNMLGTNPNEKKIKTLSRYVFLHKEKQSIDTEIERMKSL